MHAKLKGCDLYVIMEGTLTVAVWLSMEITTGVTGISHILIILAGGVNRFQREAYRVRSCMLGSTIIPEHYSIPLGTAIAGPIMGIVMAIRCVPNHCKDLFLTFISVGTSLSGLKCLVI